MGYSVLFQPGEFERIQQRYPNTVCVFVELARNTDLPTLDKHKYVVPKSITVGAFLFILRKRLKLPSDKALFIFVGNSLPCSSQTMGEIYSQHKSVDGALRITCTSESVFGTI